MIVNVLFSARDGLFEIYRQPLQDALREAGVQANISPDIAPGDVDYIVFAPNGPVTDLTPYTRCRAVLGLWAGVESIVTNPTLTQPFARMVDEDLTDGMVEWVVGQTLRHHLGLDQDIMRSDSQWVPHIPPLARDRRVGILGLGALGAACGQALSGLKFDVAGWSRSPKKIDGIVSYHGADGLNALLERSEILVLLLPLTPATENTLNASAIARLPKGAIIINPGRGPLIDDGALLAALDDGHIAQATLDVFRVEPLPQDHPYWAHPKVTVTPHIASETRPPSASRVIAENIRRGQAGQPFLHLVDRDAGY